MGFRFQNLSVLVVEDTEPMRKLVMSVLETLGVGTIYTSAEGNEGFEVFCRKKPDIVISDWHMTPVSGLELVDKIRNSRLSPNTMAPVVMMTGYSAYERVSKARDIGATEFLVKPFSANDLAKRIAYVINKPRDFVETPDYFGPDRRRSISNTRNGPDRRSR